MRFKYRKAAIKYLKAIDKPARDRILQAVEQLPDAGDIKRLQGRTPLEYRLRVGKYRVLYNMEQGFIVINNIDSRGDIYK